jgi:hypothetical protein
MCFCVLPGVGIDRRYSSPFVVDRDTVWPSTLKSGDCSMNPGVEVEHCWFAHPWIEDDADLDSVELVFGASAYPFVRSLVQQAIRQTWWIVLPLTVVICGRLVLN